MSTERSSRENDPTVRNPTNAPPCTDFITAVPMSMIVDVSLRRKYLTLVKTTHGETLLKAQKSYFKIGKLRYRPQYRIYSETGKKLVVSEDKKHSWLFTWPNEPHKECQLVEHSRYCDAVFSHPSKEGMRVEMGGLKQNKVKNTATGKVLAYHAPERSLATQRRCYDGQRRRCGAHDRFYHGYGGDSCPQGCCR